MRIMHIALGGCLKAPPIEYGITEDTGGHLAYLLGAATAQARRPDVARVDVVTRAFDDPRLGAAHARPVEELAPRCFIRRLTTARREYLSKEALEAELPALTDAFLALLDETGPPDAIHAHFADAAVLARAAARVHGVNWLFSSHSLAQDKLAGGAPAAVGASAPLARRIARERAALAAADAVIASSRDEAERQIARYEPDAEGRAHRVEPAVAAAMTDDPEPGRRLIAPLLRAPDRPIALAVARPVRRKNLAALLEAFAGDADLRARLNLVILAGQHDGLAREGGEAAETLAALRARIARADLAGRVALPPRHGGREAAALYALAARGGVFVNPALHEPFGLTTVEAARAGVPFVVTRHGGPADVARALESGELVDPRDPRDIARGLRAALDRPGRAQAAARAAARARALYDWDLWAGRVAAICAELAAPARLAGSAAPRLLVSDMDGTLTGDRDAAARFAAWRAARRGVFGFVVATGRPVSEARRVVAEWGLPAPDAFVTSVGSEIWRWTAPGRLSRCADYAALVDRGWRPGAVDVALAPLGLEAQAPCEQRRWKRSFLGSAEDARRIVEALGAARLAARVVHSHGRLIDVIPSRAGKAAAARFEARRLGVAEADVVAAGDSGNDLDMLAAFAAAIAPANAAPELARLPGLHRSPLPFADGVLDGLARFEAAGRARDADPAAA